MLQFSSRKAPKETAGVETTLFEFALKGSYESLKRFLTALGKLPEFVVVERAVFLAGVIVAGCAGGSLLGGIGPAPVVEERGEDYYVQKVIELRKDLRASPDSTSLTNELRRLEDEAASFYLTAGHKELNNRRFTEAAQKFELGLLASPGNAALTEGRMTALRRREVVRMEEQALRAKSVGNLDLAQGIFEKAANLERGNPRIEAALEEVRKAKLATNERFVIEAFLSSAPLDLNFKEAKLKDALKALGDPYHLNFVFDSEVEDAEVNVSASRVTLAQVFKMVLQASDTFNKVIGPNALLIAPNTEDKKGKYADLYTKTFHLQTEKDVKTFFFDTTTGSWQPLETAAVDGAKGEVVSLTDHFTGMAKRRFRKAFQPLIVTAPFNVGTLLTERL